MVLELSQIRELVSHQNKNDTLLAMKMIQRHLRFHTEINTFQKDAALQASIFLDWVKGILPKDKYNVFVHLFKFPLPSTDVVDDVYKELARVYESRDSNTNYRFTNPSLEEDWLDYKAKISCEKVWKDKGWEQMRIAPNSVLIIDLPQEQHGSRPEPYFYWLDIDAILNYETKDDACAMEWIIFKQGKDRIAVIDDSSYRIFKTKENSNDIESLQYEARHDLGYCPARFYWSESINAKRPEVKKNPLTKELSSLDWYLFFFLSKRHLDTYAPYPIYSSYEAECNFQNDENGDYCDGGFLRDSSNAYKILNDGTVEKCPCCGNKRVVGPGSFVEVPVPNAAEGILDMRNPVQITTIDEASLAYNVSECSRLRQEIVDSVVGSGGTVSEKEAINETQVAANFENKSSVLIKLKINFEQAQKFVDDTMCRLRYGDEFISSSINWGTEFYIFTVDELYARYKEAKANGASDAELDMLTQHINEVEHKNSPLVMSRMNILKQLEPYPHKTFAELMQLHKSGLLSSKKLAIKINFIDLINKFERENIDIVQFGSNLDLGEKIKIIYSKLEEYVSSTQYRPDPVDVDEGSKGTKKDPDSVKGGTKKE